MAITVQEAQVLFSADGLTQVRSMAGQAGIALDGATGKAGLFAKALGGIRSIAGSVAAQLGALGAGGALIGMVKLAADAETASTQFRVLTGSAEKASQVMADVQKFAAETPFQSDEIRNAARQLLAFGGSADTAIDELRMLGDIAAGTGQPLGELAELYGKARVQGRLYGEDINQLTGRGIPIIQALAKEFGVTEAEVKKLVEQGKVGFPEMQRALAGMTAPGGQFSGMMAELSETTAGKFSTFVDNVKALGMELGSVILPYASDFLTWAINAVGGIDGLGNSFRSAIDGGIAFYNTVSNGLQDIGTVVGVVIGDWSTMWQGLWADVQNWAAAAINWISDAVGVMAQKIKDMLYSLNPMQIAAALANPAIAGAMIGGAIGQGVPDLPAFQAPEPSAATMQVAGDIAAALEESRKQREQMTGGGLGAQQTSINQAAPNQAFVSQQKTAAAMSDEKQSAQLMSAQQVFNNAQQKLAQKQADVAQQQLGVAQQQLVAQQQTATGIQQLASTGVPATLG